MINKELKHIFVSIEDRSVNSHTNSLPLLLILWRSAGVYPDSLLPEGTISCLDAGYVFFLSSYPNESSSMAIIAQTGQPKV